MLANVLFHCCTPCLAPSPVMGTFLDQRCLLLSEWFSFPAVHSQYILLLSHIAVLLSSYPVLAAVCLRGFPLLKHHLRFSLAEIMWGSCRSLPFSIACVYQLYIHLLQLLLHGSMNEVVFWTRVASPVLTVPLVFQSVLSLGTQLRTPIVLVLL